MSRDTFPAKIRTLEPYAGRFAAFRLQAQACEVFFASYPAGTCIEPHTHETDNWGVVTKGAITLLIAGAEMRLAPGEWYHVPTGAVHSARCETDTEQIEFWFEGSRAASGSGTRGQRARRPVPAAYHRGAP